MLYGNKESARFRQDFSMLRINIERCNSETAKNVTCADPDSINKWLLNKNLVPFYFNEKPNLKRFDKHIIYEKKVYPSISLYGKRTYAGYNFRRNEFHRQDKWYFPQEENNVFYDMISYGQNEFNIPPEEMADTTIATINLRLDVTMVEHTREVVQIDSYLESVAGLWELLYCIFTFLFGGYINFNTQINWIKSLYWDKFVKNNIHYEECYKDVDDLSGMSYYLRSQSCFKSLFFEDGSKPDINKEFLEFGTESLLNDLNYKESIQKLDDLSKWVESLNLKLNALNNLSYRNQQKNINTYIASDQPLILDTNPAHNTIQTLRSIG